ncbi:DUF1836 domain-containing protein [Clostridium aestuarii]|uniref:DUF1836 domain-containing protein n=1 Tax=Clostridium aestuarii TaxID=338193 RepID=A0ABT4CY54_9CLOT|nr:DUF1836 domain-containing protein [Clostridium aestuarii]MCY6483901.1 DUF1836 domain-containing protein [Clostridium aestuarii]
MEFTENEIVSLIQQLSLDKDINLSDIPSLDLYMDQVITLFDNKLAHLKRTENDKILTKTMINNYTKAKILMRPNKKKYTREHIILLILIYNLKQSLSINDIASLFSVLIENLDEKNDIEIDKIYESFSKIKKIDTDNISKELKEKLELITENTNTLNKEHIDLSQMLITVLTLINEANTKKRIAEKIIDEYFINNI